MSGVARASARLAACVVALGAASVHAAVTDDSDCPSPAQIETALATTRCTKTARPGRSRSMGRSITSTYIGGSVEVSRNSSPSLTSTGPGKSACGLRFESASVRYILASTAGTHTYPVDRPTAQLITGTVTHVPVDATSTGAAA